MRKLLVILGATSTGKTDIALSLAKKFDGELVSCDSRQVYKGLDIGTGKAPSGMNNVQSTMYKKEKHWEVNGVKIWMYDVSDFKRQYTAYDYIKDANRVIEDIIKRGKLPIVVGGTGFYLKALLEGLSNLGVPVDTKLRKKLEKLSLEDLQQKLQEVSLKKWEELNNSDRQNSRRLIRYIELASTNFTSDSVPKGLLGSGFDVLKIGLTAPRQILYQRIDERVINRINKGMVKEVSRLHKNGLSSKRMKRLGLECGVLMDYLEGKIKTGQELIKILQGKIHGYARRQITWFKKEKDIFWFDIMNKNFQRELEKKATKWYYSSYYAAKN